VAQPDRTRLMGIALMIAGPAHPFAPGNAGSAATLLLAAVGYAGATIALLRMTNDEFDLPPLGTTVGS
jgi:hypothetical protein